MLLLLLQAMRGCVTRAGDKVSPTIRRTVTASLLQLLAAPEDVTRGCAAGCLAALLPSLPEEELEPILADTLLEPGADTQQTHGRSSALAVLLSASPATLAPHQDKVVRAVLAHLAGDHVSIVTNGVRCAGYLVLDSVARAAAPPPAIITPFVRSMNHSSNDVKVKQRPVNTLSALNNLCRSWCLK